MARPTNFWWAHKIGWSGRKDRTRDTQIRKLFKAAPDGCNLAGHPFVEMRSTEKDLSAVIGVAEGAVKYVHMIEAATWA